MRKAYLRILKLALVSSLSYGSIKGGEYYRFVTSVPTMNTSIEKNMDFGEFSVKPYEYRMIRVFQREKMIAELNLVVEKYASIYCLDKNSVLEVINSITNNLDSDNFVWDKNISGTDEKYDDFKSQVFFLVRDMYRRPSNYPEVEIKYCYDIEPQVGDMTIREFVFETADIIGIDRYMALAIPCLESGYFTQTYHNDSYGTGYSYNNIYHGIIEGMCNVKYGYIDRGLTTYEAMAPVYCPPSKHIWPGRVRGTEYLLRNGYKLYDEYDKELILE